MNEMMHKMSKQESKDYCKNRTGKNWNSCNRLGGYLKTNISTLNKITTNSQLISFLEDADKSVMTPEAAKYTENVIKSIKECANFNKNYMYVYDIFLAGDANKVL